jgi:hypothetical protein
MLGPRLVPDSFITAVHKTLIGRSKFACHHPKQAFLIRKIEKMSAFPAFCGAVEKRERKLHESWQGLRASCLVGRRRVARGDGRNSVYGTWVGNENPGSDQLWPNSSL